MGEIHLCFGDYVEKLVMFLWNKWAAFNTARTPISYLWPREPHLLNTLQISEIALTAFSSRFILEGSAHKCGCFQGPVAQAVVEKAQREGQWVCLQNCHLAVPWMPALEKIWENMSTVNTHINFRLWLTSYPSDKVMQGVLFVRILFLVL